MINRQLNYGRDLIRKFISEAQLKDKVLDIGAGHGDDLLFVREFNKNAQLFAVEIYPPYIKELESKGVTVFPSNIERDALPFENESLDMILINQVFEHVKDVFWLLHEITRVLKKDGYLIVGVPNLASLHNRVLLLLGKQPTSIQNDSAHVRGYTKTDFKNLLNSGFKDGYVLKGYGGSNFYPFPETLAKPLAKILPGMAWGIFMKWQKVKDYQFDGYLKFPVENRLETSFYLGKS